MNTPKVEGSLREDRDQSIQAIRDALVHAVYPGLSIASAKDLRDKAWDALALLAMEKPGV
jgi:hypothetical protein